MLLIVTSALIINLFLHATSQKLNRPKEHHPNEPFLRFLGDAEPSSSSSDTSSSSSTSSEETISVELRKFDSERTPDVLTLVVVDNDQSFTHGRRGKLLEPYQSLGVPPEAFLNHRRGDEQLLRNSKHAFKKRQVNRKGDPKEVYQNSAANQAVAAKRGEPQKVGLQVELQNNPYDEELLSVKNEGLAIPEFPNVRVLPLNPKGSKQNGVNPQGQRDEEAENGGKTFKVKERQLLALRKRWSKKCDKAASKECKKACKKAMKFACSDYKCQSGLKRAFKKECKRSCKARFIQRGGGCGV